MRLRFAIIGAIMAPTIAVLGMTAPAMASAHGSPVAVPHAGKLASNGCPSGATCSYDLPNTTGTPGPVYGNNTNDRQYHLWAYAESIVNEGTQCTDWIYYNENYGNPNFALYLGYWVPNLSGTWGWHHLWSNHWCNPG
jgi:Peptidase inhibitor family I36